MFKIIKAPYPLFQFNRRNTLMMLGIGIFVVCFLLYFQPFGTDRTNFKLKNWFLSGYGVVISGSILLCQFLCFHFYFKNKKEDSWTIGKQILWVFFFTSCALLASYLYKQLFFNLSISAKDFFYFYKMAGTIAVFPIIIITLLDYIYLLQKNQSLAAKINDKTETTKSSSQPSSEQFKIFAENGKDSFEIPLRDLRYIQSADNYIEIVFLKDGQAKKEMLRNTLQGVEKQISIPFVYRCHRSFMVNLQQVETVSGNAQGHKLHMRGIEVPVPVSRSKSKEVLGRLEGNLN